MPRAKKKDKATAEQERRLEVLDPRQSAAMLAYSNPSSPTFGNLKRSCINAGFSEQYADNITNLMPDWLSGFMGDDAAKLALVERNLYKFLDLKTSKQATSPTGKPLYVDKDRKIPLMVEDPRMLEPQMKVTLFVAERLNRKKYGKDDKVHIGVTFNMAARKQSYMTND